MIASRTHSERTITEALGTLCTSRQAERKASCGVAASISLATKPCSGSIIDCSTPPAYRCLPPSSTTSQESSCEAEESRRASCLGAECRTHPLICPRVPELDCRTGATATITGLSVCTVYVPLRRCLNLTPERFFMPNMRRMGLMTVMRANQEARGERRQRLVPSTLIRGPRVDPTRTCNQMCHCERSDWTVESCETRDLDPRNI